MPTEKRLRQREGRASRQAELQRAQRKRRQRTQIIVGVVVAVIVIGALVLANRGGKSNTNVNAGTTTTTAGGATTTAAPGATTSTTTGGTTTTAKAGGTTTTKATTATTKAPSATTTTAAAAGSGAAISGATPCPKADGSSPRTTSFSEAPPMCIDTAKTYVATMDTDAGQMIIALDPKKAPKTVNNFVVLSRYHFFDGLTFHRVIPGFVDQGGDPAGTGQGGPGYTFADELPKAGEYQVGSLAMANSGPDTNGSQFFIIVGPQGAALQPQYSLFGQITTGIDVAEKIESDGDASGTPKVVHKMTHVTIKES